MLKERLLWPADAHWGRVGPDGVRWETDPPQRRRDRGVWCALVPDADLTVAALYRMGRELAGPGPYPPCEHRLALVVLADPLPDDEPLASLGCP